MALSLMDHLNNTPDDIYRHIIEFVGVDIPTQKYSSIVWCNLCGENNKERKYYYKIHKNTTKENY